MPLTASRPGPSSRTRTPIASAGEVQAAVASPRRRDRARLLGERYPLVLAVMGGAVVFAGQLLPLLRFPLDFDYIHASRYGDGDARREHRLARAPARHRAAAARCSCSTTSSTTARPWRRSASGCSSSARAASTAPCWSRRRSGTKKPITADFVGLQIPDRFVFGCGMDAKGFWRNLPEIRAMKE